MVKSFLNAFTPVSLGMTGIERFGEVGEVFFKIHRNSQYRIGAVTGELSKK